MGLIAVKLGDMEPKDSIGDGSDATSPLETEGGGGNAQNTADGLSPIHYDPNAVSALVDACSKMEYAFHTPPSHFSSNLSEPMRLLVSAACAVVRSQAKPPIEAPKDFSAGSVEPQAYVRSAVNSAPEADGGQGRVESTSTDSLSPLSQHEVLADDKTPWIYLVHLAIAARHRGLNFQLDAHRFFIVCSDVDWAFLKGEAVMG